MNVPMEMSGGFTGTLNKRTSLRSNSTYERRDKKYNQYNADSYVPFFSFMLVIFIFFYLLIFKD